jgi:hypothetical protein
MSIERTAGVGNVGICGLAGKLIAPGPAEFLLMGDSTGKKATYNISWAVGTRGRGFGTDKKHPYMIRVLVHRM